MFPAPAQPRPAERRDREQYFFDAPTVRAWAAVASGFEHPCLLCAPTVGAELAARGRRVTILDVDERFAVYPGFRVWDLSAPAWLPDRFGVILCDPPFFAVSVGRLAAAVDVLAAYDPDQPLAITYLKRREAPLLRGFARYRLRPTGVRAGYHRVAAVGRNEIEIYANFDWPAPVVQRSFS